MFLHILKVVLDIFDNQTEHFGSNRIVLKELNKHGYLNKDAKQANTLLNGAITTLHINNS